MDRLGYRSGQSEEPALVLADKRRDATNRALIPLRFGILTSSRPTAVELRREVPGRSSGMA
jgi:hypothetical protein